MKKRIIINTFAVLCGLSCLAVFSGCGGDGSATNANPQSLEDQQLAVAKAAEGKVWLEKGQANEARALFDEAIQLDPDNLNARFGYAFSTSLTCYELLSTLLTMVRLEEPDWPNEAARSLKADGDPGSQGEAIAALLDQALGQMNTRLEKVVENYEFLITHPQAASFAWRIEGSIPIYQSLEKTADIEGTLYVSDVRILSAVADIFYSLTYLLGHTDLSGDIGQIVAMVKDGGLDINALLPKLADVLNTSPNFADYNLDAAVVGATVGGRWKHAFTQTLTAFEELSSGACADDPDNQPTDRFFYCYDDIRDGKQLNMHIVIDDPDQPGTPLPLFLTVLAGDDKDEVEAFRDNLVTPGNALALDGPILTSFGSVFAVANAFGLLKLIEFDLGLGAAANSQVIGTFLKGFIPKGLAMDFGTFWQHPLALRGILPAWTTDQPTGENYFYMEWECPAETADDGMPNGSGSFLCEAASVDDGLADSAHFAGTGHEQAADGVAVPGPYFVWQDPTMAGWIYVDKAQVGLGGSGGYEPATQTSLNLMISKVIDMVMGLVN